MCAFLFHPPHPSFREPMREVSMHGYVSRFGSESNFSAVVVAKRPENLINESMHSRAPHRSSLPNDDGKDGSRAR